MKITKRIFTIFSLLIMLVGCNLNSNSKSNSMDNIDITTYLEYEIVIKSSNLNEEYIRITSCDETLKEIVIPSKAKIKNKTYDIKEIKQGAFQDCTSVEKITLPFIGGSRDNNQYLGYIFGADSIEKHSTYIPSCLKEVIILEGCTTIGECAFYECSSLTSVVIPNSVTTIERSVFLRCDSLKHNEYDNGLYLGNEKNPYLVLVESKDRSITSCIINDNTRFIYSDVFYGCSSWRSIIIPNGVTTIGRSAFEECSFLTNITIPNSVTSIDWYAFERCSSLTSVVIPNSVTAIGVSAFYGCSSLTIYCEASSQPSGWDNFWNNSNCPVVWGYKSN